MKPVSVFAIGLAILGAFPGAASCTDVQPVKEEGQPVSKRGQIIVRFEKSISAEEAQNIITRVGGREVDRMLDGSMYVVDLPYPAVQGDVINALSASKGVVYAEASRPVSIPVDPDIKNRQQEPELLPLPKVQSSD